MFGFTNGVIGGITAFTIYAIVKKYQVREIADMFGASIPLGYTFGRLGNFANGELWGRVTSSPIGMVFPNAPSFSASLPWVQEVAEKAGIPIPGPDALINLPRYPSQLFEALFEGVVLWAIIWLVRNRKPFKGLLAALYIGGYGLIRFVIEYFREPDADLGYRIQFGQQVGLADIAHLHPLGSLSTGQILCLGLVLLAIVWCLVCARLPDRKPIIFYPEEEEAAEAAAARREEERKLEAARRRKMMKKLK
jgi:phosphatidylglycerol:prolipoprotein diacylglycerol transferase